MTILTAFRLFMLRYTKAFACSSTKWLNPLTYCAADPVNKIDPDGKNIAVLLVDGLIGHLAMLIQQPDKTWSYYSINGDKIYESTNGTSGGPTNDVGVGTWESPKDFLQGVDKTSSENEGNSMEEMTRFDYSEAYEIATTPEQDKLIAEEFSKIAEEDYDLVNNNCAHAVQRSLNAAGIKTSGQMTTDKKTNPNKPWRNSRNSFIKPIPGRYLQTRPADAYFYIRMNNPDGFRHKTK